MKMKKLLSLLLALMMAVTLAACGNGTVEPDDVDPEDLDEQGLEDVVTNDDSDLAYVTDKGTIVVGYTLYAPMNYFDENGEFTGFDTELSELVFDRLGLDVKFVEIVWETKEVELAAKNIDCIWNGMTITDDRKENMEVTDPYLKNIQVLLMKTGSDYVDHSSLEGLVLVAEQGSAGEEAIEEIMDDEEFGGATYIAKTTQTECLMEVKAGTASGAVLDQTLAEAMTGEGTDYEDLEIVDYLVEEYYGIAFRNGSDLCEAVNKILDEMRADGSLAELAEKYGLTLAD